MAATINAVSILKQTDEEVTYWDVQEWINEAEYPLDYYWFAAENEAFTHEDLTKLFDDVGIEGSLSSYLASQIMYYNRINV